MLSKLNIKLKAEGQEKLNYNMSSIMQGILMEKLPIEYVEKLHRDGLHPYQQFLQINGEEYSWNIKRRKVQQRESDYFGRQTSILWETTWKEPNRFRIGFNILKNIYNCLWFETVARK